MSARRCSTHYYACDCREANFKTVEEKLRIAEAALELVASPKRQDGTYNRCREACEIIARETLAKIRGGKG